MNRAAAVLAGISALGPTGSRAAAPEPPSPGSLTQRGAAFFSVRNFTLQAGAGLCSFTERGARAVTEPGPAWMVRGLLGLDHLLGLEVAYLGGANRLHVPGRPDAWVLRTSWQAAGRVAAQLRRGQVLIAPYAALGMALDLYDIVGDTTPAIATDGVDAAFAAAVGAGMVLRLGRLSLDVQALFRPSRGDDLLRPANTSPYRAGQNNVVVGGALGYSF